MGIRDFFFGERVGDARVAVLEGASVRPEIIGDPKRTQEMLMEILRDRPVNDELSRAASVDSPPETLNMESIAQVIRRFRHGS